MTVGGIVTDGFGVDAANCSMTAVGLYEIILNCVDPHSGAQITLPHGSAVVATIEGTSESYNCSMINTSVLDAKPIGVGSVLHGRFWVRICKNTLTGGTTPVLNCTADQQAFSFVVFARP